MRSRVVTVSLTENISVTGTFSPAEPMVRYYKDMSGYPGSSAEFEITDISADPQKLIDFMNSVTPLEIDLWEVLTDKCLTKITEDEE